MSYRKVHKHIRNADNITDEELIMNSIDKNYNLTEEERKRWAKDPCAKSSYPTHMQEKDPSGKDAHDPGAKLDADKVRLYQLLSQFTLALRAVAEVGEHGAKKYTLGGWQYVEDGYNRYSDALLRHCLSVDGDVDSDSGLLHDAHAAWNALARLELKLRNTHGTN